MTATTDQFTIDPGVLRSLMSEDIFRPGEPQTLADTGLSEALVESLVLKHLLLYGGAPGRSLSNKVCLPFSAVTKVLETLRTRQLVGHGSAGRFNDFTYVLTERGCERAKELMRECAYVGAAPVRLAEYVTSVEAQSIAHESPTRARLMKACEGISVETQLFQSLGPAINSSGGLFLYGAPGNGKSTLARRVTACFGQRIWIPQAILEGGYIIRLFDNQFHRLAEEQDEGPLRTSDVDRRWVQITRPTVVVGG